MLSSTLYSMVLMKVRRFRHVGEDAFQENILFDLDHAVKVT